MGIVEVGVNFLMKGHNDRCGLVRQSVTDLSTPVAVTQALDTVFLPAFVYSFGLPIADSHDPGRFLQSQGVLSHLLKNVPPMNFLPAQDDKSLHVVHLHEGDIFSLQLQGTKSHC